MKNIMLGVALLCHLVGYCQTNYYRYDSRTGASEKIGYSEPANSQQYSSYTPPYDLRLYERALAKRNADYENHVADIQDEIQFAAQAIFNLTKVDVDAGNELSLNMKNYINKINSTPLDYSDFNVYQSVRQTFRSYRQNAEALYNERSHHVSYSTRQLSNSIETNEQMDDSYSGVVNVYTCSPIVEEPSDNAKELFRACKDERLTILYRVNKYYYCVKCGNIKGYILRNWIKP